MYGNLHVQFICELIKEPAIEVLQLLHPDLVPSLGSIVFIAHYCHRVSVICTLKYK